MNSPAGTATPSTDSDPVSERLRHDIVTGAFAPGSRLGIKALCDRYGKGNSPVREALHRLAGERVVEFIGQRGFRVPPLALDDLDDLTALRSLIETAAVRLAIARGSDTWEEDLVVAFHRLALQSARLDSGDADASRRYDAAHRQFHLALCAGAQSQRLSDLQANLYDQAFRYRQFMHREPVSPAELLAEHSELMRLALSRQADAAVGRLQAHLSLTRGPVSRHLFPAAAT